MNSIPLPVVASVDVLVVGGTAPGVSLALASAGLEGSVFLTSGRPYLGEDVCGDMRFWESPGVCDLSRRLYSSAPLPCTPMHAKLTLEQSLVGANVPFLLNTHPTGVLVDEHGAVFGAHFSTRSGPLAVLARTVVDASTERTLARVGGLPGGITPTGRQCVLHTTLCHDEGTDAPVPIHARPPGFCGTIADKPYALSARVYQLEVDLGEGSVLELARAEAEVVERCWVPGEYQHQERLRLRDPLPTPSETAPEGFLLLAPSLPEGVSAAMDAAERLAQDLLQRARARSIPERLRPRTAGEESLASGRLVNLLQAPRRGLQGVASLSLPSDRVPLLGQCDVLVLGGGTGGAPAAIAASRAGASTVVVEATDVLGGVGTAGQISVYWCGNRVGFTEEIDRGVAALEHEDVRQALKPGSWTPAAKSEWYHRTCHQAGAAMLFRSVCAGVWVDAGRVRGLLVASPYGTGLIRAACVVDASGCADVPAAAGVPTRVVGADHVAVQGTGLAAFQPGRVYHNSDHNFCDDTDLWNTTAYLVSAKLKFRDHFDAGQLVDSRERRQIVGEIELGPADFLGGRRYPDTVCVATSNFDSHGFTVHPLFMCKAPDKQPHWADVPFRALLPQGLERVLVTGLGVSAHRDALPVIRMQPDVQNQGYAAGYAAARAAQTGCDLRRLPMNSLQTHLVEIGSLPQRVLSDKDTFPVSDHALQQAVDEGWDTYHGLALMFADPERAIPLLQKALLNSRSTAASLRYAEVLALLGVNDGAGLLAQALDAGGWDAGWNYMGMHQFGMSLSQVDVRLICLGTCGDATIWDTLLRKADSLNDAPDFSHCRALAEAFETLYPRHPDARAAVALERVLQLPGTTGHHQHSLQEMQERQDGDPNQNDVRNVSLRELHLARGLFRCGDPHGLGRRILEAYAHDLRGHYARHAQAVLDARPLPT